VRKALADSLTNSEWDVLTTRTLGGEDADFDEEDSEDGISLEELVDYSSLSGELECYLVPRDQKVSAYNILVTTLAIEKWSDNLS